MPLSEEERAVIAAQIARATLGLHTQHVRPDGTSVCAWDLTPWPCPDAARAEQTLRPQTTKR